MMARLELSFVAAAASFLLAVSPAQAQVSTEDLARRLVGEGIEAAKARDWVSAKESFQRAYEVQPLPLTLYNLAAAQEKTGDLVQADRSYRVFLRETQVGEYDGFRESAQTRRVALRQRIAYVVIQAPNLVRTDVLRVGSTELAHAVLGQAVPSNPGPLLVEVERGGQVVAVTNVELAEGASARVRLDVPPYLPTLPKVAAATPDADPTVQVSSGPTEARDETGGGGVLQSGWFWTVVGVLAVAGAGVGGYFALRPGDPYVSNLERVTISGR